MVHGEMSRVHSRLLMHKIVQEYYKWEKHPIQVVYENYLFNMYQRADFDKQLAQFPLNLARTMLVQLLAGQNPL